MGLLDFVQEAGENLLAKVRGTPTDAEIEQALTQQVRGLGIGSGDLQIRFNDGVATVLGTASSQEEREKVVLAVGNTKGVARVDDQLKVERPEPEAKLYTVKRGDSLSKIAKREYGDAMKYPVIFEANTPMLKDPDKIYPGQVLRIPPLKG
jgi:nucleoid-associated protein YgaU